MNPRLRQLMVQADYPAPEIASRAQRLAELIIQDCMDVVDGYTKGRTFDTHYDAVVQIEQLFGVKHNGVEE
jgi:hypothetical protein